MLAVIKSVAYLTFDRMLAHCRTSFCYIHRPKAASRDRQELAESPLSQSNIFINIERQLCGRSLSQHKLQVKFKKLNSIA